MGDLLLIILVLFAVLAIVVKLTEKYAKPMDSEQDAKWSRIIIILIAILLLGRLVQHYFMGG